MRRTPSRKLPPSFWLMKRPERRKWVMARNKWLSEETWFEQSTGCDTSSILSSSWSLFQKLACMQILQNFWLIHYYFDVYISPSSKGTMSWLYTGWSSLSARSLIPCWYHFLFFEVKNSFTEASSFSGCWSIASAGSKPLIGKSNYLKEFILQIITFNYV